MILPLPFPCGVRTLMNVCYDCWCEWSYVSISFYTRLCKFVNFFCLWCGENKVNMMDLVPRVRMKVLKCLQKQDGFDMFELLEAPFSNLELELLWAALIISNTSHFSPPWSTLILDILLDGYLLILCPSRPTSNSHFGSLSGVNGWYDFYY